MDGIVIFGLICWLMKPVPTLFSLIISILFILAHVLINEKYHQYRRIIATYSDKRVNAFSEFIHGCYDIKMNNWEKLMIGQIEELRQNESISIQHASYLRTFVMSLPTISIPMISFAIFGSTWLLGYSLDLINTFTVLGLLIQMRSTVSNFMTTAIDKINDLQTAS